MSVADAFAPAEVHYRNEVLKETWGHLAPLKNKIYRGRLVYAVGCYGNDQYNPTIIVSEFDDLEDSPWWFDAMNEFVQNQETEPGCVYEFRGMFRNYSFNGEVRCLFNWNNDTSLGA